MEIQKVNSLVSRNEQLHQKFCENALKTPKKNVVKSEVQKLKRDSTLKSIILCEDIFNLVMQKKKLDIMMLDHVLQEIIRFGEVS